VLAIDSSLQAVVDKVVPLTEYAWRFRYPGEVASLSREEAAEALALAREVYEAIAARLPTDARP